MSKSFDEEVREILDKIIVHICTHCAGTGQWRDVKISYDKDGTAKSKEKAYDCPKCKGKGYELEIAQALSALKALFNKVIGEMKIESQDEIWRNRGRFGEHTIQEVSIVYKGYNQALEDIRDRIKKELKDK